MDIADYIYIKSYQQNNADNFNKICIDYDNKKITLNDLFSKHINTQLNYKIIRHIPILLLLSIIICIILIIFSSLYSDSLENKLLYNILNKFCNLSILSTSIILGVYLLTFRLEYRYKLNMCKNMEVNADIANEMNTT
jgi:hypothetical protein